MQSSIHDPQAQAIYTDQFGNVLFQAANLNKGPHDGGSKGIQPAIAVQQTAFNEALEDPYTCLNPSQALSGSQDLGEGTQ